VGATGDLVSFSFHPNKNMTTIGGRALALNNEREAAIVDELRFHGIKRLADGTRDVERAGVKYNFSDVSARLGLEQLAHLEDWCRAVRGLRRATSNASRATIALTPERRRRATTLTSWNMSRCCCRCRRCASTRTAFMDADARRKASQHRRLLRSDPPHHALSATRDSRGMFPSRSASARETVHRCRSFPRCERWIVEAHVVQEQ